MINRECCLCQMTIPEDHVEGSFTIAYVSLQSASTVEETEPYHDHNNPDWSTSLSVRVKLVVQAGLPRPKPHLNCLLFLSSLDGWAIPNPASPDEHSQHRIVADKDPKTGGNKNRGQIMVTEQMAAAEWDHRSLNSRLLILSNKAITLGVLNIIK